MKTRITLCPLVGPILGYPAIFHWAAQHLLWCPIFAELVAWDETGYLTKYIELLLFDITKALMLSSMPLLALIEALTFS